MIATATTTWVSSARAPFVTDLDRWLRPEHAWSMADEYPQIFGEKSSARSVIATDGVRVLAHAACEDISHCERTGAGRTTTRLRLVGSVAVDPAHRGQGLGRDIIEAVLADFHASDANTLVLWSDKPDFYARFGFRPWGHELWVQPTPARPSRRVRPARSDDLDFLVGVHHDKARHVRRTRERLALLLTIPRTQCWILEDARGNPCAYACVGKGLDFAGIAHDSGGRDDDLAELLRALPIQLAILPSERAPLAMRVGPTETHPLGLAIEKTATRAQSLEGLDSI